MEIKIYDGVVELNIDSTIYNEDVLYKCFYWYGATYSIDISSNSSMPGFYYVILRPFSDTTTENFEQLIERIKRDLVDFKLRDIVTKETQTIRELITAKAFAYFDVDENPNTDVSDPVGFTPIKKSDD